MRFELWYYWNGTPRCEPYYTLNDDTLEIAVDTTVIDMAMAIEAVWLYNPAGQLIYGSEPEGFKRPAAA